MQRLDRRAQCRKVAVVVHDVIGALEPFRGTFFQQPPAFSAKKIDGTRSYRLARRLRASGPTGPSEAPALPAPVAVTTRSARWTTVYLSVGKHRTRELWTARGHHASLDQCNDPIDGMAQWLIATKRLFQLCRKSGNALASRDRSRGPGI